MIVIVLHIYLHILNDAQCALVPGRLKQELKLWVAGITTMDMNLMELEITLQIHGDREKLYGLEPL